MNDIAELVFRRGIAPMASDEQLKSLLEALRNDDQRLVQGSTTCPPQLMCVAEWPVEACCAVSWLGWQGKVGMTVEQVGEMFASYCYEADKVLGPAEVRHFLNWFDDTPRDKMRLELSLVIESILEDRAKE